MTKIALGTVQFGQSYGITNKLGKVKKSEVFKIIKFAKKKNIDLLDTAITYGDSEKVLGTVGVTDFNVVTKLPDCPVNSLNLISWVKNHINKSLKRLGLKNIYGLLIHRSENLRGVSGIKIKDILYQLKSEGLIKKIGVSIYNPDELEELTKKIKLDLVQAPINLIDQRLESSGWLSRLHDEGVEIHSRSTFLQGLLLLSRNNIPNKFERWANIWDRWEYEKKKNKKSPLEICLSYPLSLKKVDRVIVGVDSLKHLHSILIASKNIDKIKDYKIIKSIDPLLLNPFNWNKL
ncbi:aldo/keto reductase [Candidatus Pelagibacter sp.]|nr:aldo/keto reductase [Candidatus Pelagibacter sp.]